MVLGTDYMIQMHFSYRGRHLALSAIWTMERLNLQPDQQAQAERQTKLFAIHIEFGSIIACSSCNSPINQTKHK